eukprot:Skav225499  [mRNA]  locus=scaffold1721:82913:83260:+ [translate_table: standard]
MRALLATRNGFTASPCKDNAQQGQETSRDIKRQSVSIGSGRWVGRWHWETWWLPANDRALDSGVPHDTTTARSIRSAIFRILSMEPSAPEQLSGLKLFSKPIFDDEDFAHGLATL